MLDEVGLDLLPLGPVAWAGMFYLGGLEEYRARLAEESSSGYPGFVTSAAEPAPV